ncbi:YbhB/YbcL family Raf kinase inhibitor-like protein [Tsukamurella soli]|uniref:YbhB/YbcL family Raf kinase inhibitor-like protein n=1 Tax=Tsukamurella soli TaxID=644556 RepID=A0ABP8J0W8_9ACTN
MTLLGTLLRNQRARDARSAWNLPGLQGPDLLTVTSSRFEHGGTIPHEHAGKRVGGLDVSPDLTWSAPPPETTALLLAVEDLDAPILPTPAVHCLALIDPARLDVAGHLPPGALSARAPAAGVRILRSTVGRGYHGPEPLKGHGPHRYTFELFALTTEDGEALAHGGAPIDRARPRIVLSSITAPVTARGRLTGVAER